MAWTYGDDPVISSTATAAQKRDAVRFLAQENQTATQRVSDAEVAFLIAQEANVWKAAARCAELVANRMGAVASRTVDRLTITYGRQDYLNLAKSLRARGRSNEVPFVGGISVSEKDLLPADSDWPPPWFGRATHEDQGGTTGTITRNGAND